MTIFIFQLFLHTFTHMKDDTTNIIIKHLSEIHSNPILLNGFFPVITQYKSQQNLLLSTTFLSNTLHFIKTA